MMELELALAIALCLASLFAAILLLRLAFQLLVRAEPRRVYGYGDLTLGQQARARVPHGITMALVGAWYLALPFIFLLLGANLKLLGPLFMVGVGVGFVGTAVARRRIR